jgi:hypothetical protein
MITDKETRLFLRLALIGVAIIALTIAFYAPEKEQAGALAWLTLP